MYKLLIYLFKYSKYSFLFYFCYIFLINVLTKKIAKNFVSLVFCCYILSNYLGMLIKYIDYEYLLDVYNITIISYFIYDIIRIINEELKIYNINYNLKNNKISFIMILHHVLTIFAVNLDVNIYKWDEVIFFAELSNFPIFILYHFLHYPDCNNEVILWTKIQKFIYIPIRLLVFAYYMVIVYNNILLYQHNIIFWYIVAPLIYGMGIGWSIKLLKQ